MQAKSRPPANPGLATQLAFVANVRRALIRAEITQSDLASLSGLSRPYLNRLLQGNQVPGIDTAATIAAALEIPLAKLLRPSRRPPPKG